MRLLITGADSRLARSVMLALRDTTSVVAFDTQFAQPPPEKVERVEGDVRDPNAVNAALEGVDAVLHLEPLSESPGDDITKLDRSTRGTYVLLTSALDRGVRRFAVGSTLDLFNRLPSRWHIDEGWRPRPEPRIDQMRAWLTELSARELLRSVDFPAVCLRFGHPVDDADAASQPYDPRWIHTDDAIQGVERALSFERPAWSVFHITSSGPHSKIRLGVAGREDFGYRPAHDLSPGDRLSDSSSLLDHLTPQEALAPRNPVRSHDIRNVVVFGAGGPLGAVTMDLLANEYRLRLTDVRPIEEIALDGARADQEAGAPFPEHPGGPHESIVVDITDQRQVVDACKGMDAIINCTVIRDDPVEAFRVNTLGAYNVAHAAVAHGIRRVIHTGPQLVTVSSLGEYLSDYDIPADVPPRPGRALYGHTKYLGQEIMRIFAEYYGLEVPVLLFSELTQPEPSRPGRPYPFAVTWRDAALSIRRALEISRLPQPFEVFHVCADLPHGRFDNRKVKEVLGWQPRDDLHQLWSDP